MHPMTIFRDLAMVTTAAFLAGCILCRLRQPLILGYVAAGLILSPLTPGPRIHDVHTFEVMAEVGVLLLMFSVGIEFSIPDLLRVKWVALVGAPFGISLSIALGAGVGWLLGWPLLQGIAAGCIISVASTMVLIRLLMDRGELTSASGRVMIAITLVEDLVMVLLTILLPSLGAPSPAGSFAAVGKIGIAVLILAPFVAVAWRLVPTILARVGQTRNGELSVLLALAICLVVAAVTEAAGLSLALGAFIGGLLIGNSKFAHEFAQKTNPIRDAFVAFFFVAVGMLIDPRALFANWRLLAILVGLILVGKLAVWYGVVRLFGYPARIAGRAAAGLTQIGEFSFILAQVALHAGLIAKELYHATLAASLITIMVNTAVFKWIKPDREEETPNSAEEPAAEAPALLEVSTPFDMAG